MSNNMKGYSWSTPRYARDVAREIGELLMKNQDDVKITGMANADQIELEFLKHEYNMILAQAGVTEARAAKHKALGL